METGASAANSNFAFWNFLQFFSQLNPQMQKSQIHRVNRIYNTGIIWCQAAILDRGEEWKETKPLLSILAEETDHTQV